MFRIVNGEKQLVERQCYNETGQNVSRMYVTHNRKEKVIQHDSFIIHSPDYYSCIAFDRNPVYDSTNSRVVHGTCDTLIKDCYQKGKVVFHDVYISDSLPRKRYMETPGKRYSATIHTWNYEYDDQGKLERLEESDTIASGDRRTLKWGYGYTATYDPQFELRMHYTFTDSSSRLTHATYQMSDNVSHIIVMYDDKEQPESTFRESFNVTGEDSLSTQRDKNEILTNRNVTTYSSNSAKTEHADGTGYIFKTAEKFFDENHLIIKRVDTDHRTNVVDTFIFEYTYF